METADPESIRLALALAWRDHHHARDQTWKAVEVEALLAAGLVGIDWQIQNVAVTCAVGVLVMLGAVFGVLISLHHRNKVEMQAFTHITNCERALGLLRDDLISPGAVKLPSPLVFTDVFRLSVRNTAVFILRMHITVMTFAALYIFARIVLGAAPTAT